MGLKKATVKLGADISEFQTKMRKASRSFKRMGKSMQRVGRSMSMSLTLPLAAFAAASVKAFDVQAKAEAKLLTGLKGNEEAFKSLKKQAQELQKITLFGDEQTMSAQAMLATMGLEEEAIKRLTPLIQDMATAKGMDLKAAADLVAKSVGSSTNALSRYGITIEGAVGSTERLDSAVNALSGQFKGQSKAAAEAGAGGLTQLKNSFGDLMETIGGMLMPVLTKFIEKIKGGIKVIQGLSDEQIKSRIKWLAIAAAIGPVLIIVGKLTTAVGVLIPVISKLGVAILANPYLALGAALALIITKMIFFSRQTKQTRIDLSNIEKPASDAAKRLKEINNELDKLGQSKFDLLKAEALEQQARILKEHNNLTHLAIDAKAALQKEYDQWGDTLKRIIKEEKEFNESLKDGVTILGAQTQATNNLEIAEYQLSIQLGELRKAHTLLSESISNEAQAIIDKYNSIKEAVTNFLDTAVTGYVSLFGHQTKFVEVQGVMTEVTKTTAEKFKDMTRQILSDLGRMIVKAAILAALMSVIGGTSVGQAIGMVNSISFGTAFGEQFGVAGKASGGPVAGNTPYLVGEKGPELFMSNTSGTIIPNHQLGGTQTIIPDVRISGSDLLIVFNKTRKEEGGVNV